MDKELKYILNSLITSCINLAPSAFLPALKSQKVGTDLLNKSVFYSYFKEKIADTRNCSIGILTCKIKKFPVKDKRGYELIYYVKKKKGGLCPKYRYSENVVNLNFRWSLDFYDQVHKYPRLVIPFRFTEGKVILNISPF
ncbi:hypothetical protein GCM10027516_19690 [Niabella aquatica]